MYMNMFSYDAVIHLFVPMLRLMTAAVSQADEAAEETLEVPQRKAETKVSPKPLLDWLEGIFRSPE